MDALAREPARRAESKAESERAREGHPVGQEEGCPTEWSAAARELAQEPGSLAGTARGTAEDRTGAAEPAVAQAESFPSMTPAPWSLPQGEPVPGVVRWAVRLSRESCRVESSSVQPEAE